MITIFFYINNDNNERDEIYIYIIYIYKKHLNNSLNILSFFLIFLYEKMKKKDTFLKINNFIIFNNSND